MNTTIIETLPEVITTADVAEINSVVDGAIISAVRETKQATVPARTPSRTARPEPRAWSRIGNVD